MSGKPYAIRELKMIVDYLVEHKAYGEVRGRKMWMDFASTRLTKRTWQSLKEAFLKRILPDITNPYFRLDVDQIHSFKRGQNLTEKHKKHLDFEPVGDKSNKNDPNGDNEQPSISNNNEENATGEDTTCSKVVHNRASTETLILENYYETGENLQKDLERSTDEEQDDKQNNDKSSPQCKPSVKSIRDFIEYTEPLTPMLQEVLDDFATDDESDRMLIDEDYVGSERKSISPDPAVKSQSILTSKVVPVNSKSSDNERNREKTNNDSNKEVPESNKQPAKTIEKELTENNAESTKNVEASLSQFEDVMKLVDKALSKHLGCQLDTQKNKSQEKTQNSNENCSAMTDSLLPNNQEAINSETFPNASSLPADKSNDDQNGDQPSKKRKRSSSAEKIEIIKSKKQKNVNHSNTNNKKHSDTVEVIETNVTSKLTDVEQNLDLNKEINQNNINDPNADSGTEKDKAESMKKKRNLTLNNGKSLSKGSKKQNKPVPNEKGTDHSNSDSSEIIVNQSAQVENPCLKSVSLYDEQFSLTKYSDSDVEIVEVDGKKKKSKKILEPKQTDTTVVEKAKDVILLRSHSNSESENESAINVSPRLTMKQQRDKIANIFGLTNGGQSRRMNGRKRTTSHHSPQYSSESSEWTSASDSEFVSPPRGRKYRYPRKHFKPHSGRVISLEECGGMYVMLGKKVYPLTKQGKTVQNYVRKSSESDPDEEDDYWKKKYIEEKKLTSELKKILQKAKQNAAQIVEEPESPVEVPPLPPVQRQQMQSVAKESVNGDELATRKDTEIPDKQSDEKTLKIKFTKKDEEIQLEGHWQHINPVLAQVVSMFHKDAAIKQPDPATIVEVSSGTTTPRPLAADTVVKEKINQLESDIFNEIVEQHKEDEQTTPTEDIQDSSSKTSVEKDTNVTVRKKRGRPVKLIPPAGARSPSKSAERSPEPETKSNDVEKEEQVISEVPPTVERRTTRTPKKLLEVAAKATRQVRTRKSSAKSEENEDEVLYKFPSPPPTKRGRKSTTNVTNNAIEPAGNHSKPAITSPEGLSNNSINSNQGYQDSDASPFNIGLRRKRRFSVSTMSLKRKSYRKSRSKSLPNLVDYETSESSNSSFSISVKSVTQSTINSEVHRSESYQLLMPRTKKMVHTLEKIEEATNERNIGNVTHRRMSNLSVEIEVSEGDIRTASNDIASSSNISFPPSPELSIVENISVSKNMVNVNEDHPTINEMQSQLTAMNPNENKFLMSAVDVSMPLMAQDCSLQKHLINVLKDFSDLNHARRVLSTPDLSAPKMSSMTESILNEIKSVSNEVTLSDSLDRRLEQLLLESAQKSTTTKTQNLMEVDTEVKKNPRSKKRSSTPNKKKTLLRKTKIPEVSVVEEECKAHCSRNGRRSCPPSINIVYHKGDVPDNLQINIHEETTLDVAPVTKRKSGKKDVIKVKILRPKKKPVEKRKSPKIRTSGDIECDNESGVFLQDTSDLIHNHSELCLFNKDCTRDLRRDSVEFIETTAQSIITLNSSASPEGSKENIDVNIVIADGEVTSELYCNNTQFTAEANVSEAVRPENDNTQYFTPVSPNSSIITEDLSNDIPNVQSPKPRPTKWYLLSEEDTTETCNANYFDSYQDETSDVRSFGANLQQLFPVTCSVPDLSTITEMSEKSPKLGVGNRGDTDFDSQSTN